MEASIISIASGEDARSAGVDASLPSVLRWMGCRDDNWLIIFDGADMGYELVEAFMPPGKHGNIIISSRNSTMNRLASPSSHTWMSSSSTTLLLSSYSQDLRC
jgi:hypothetical protein